MGRRSNKNEKIDNDKYVFDIKNEDNKSEKIHFNKKSKKKELDNLINIYNELCIKQQSSHDNEHTTIS